MDISERIAKETAPGEFRRWVWDFVLASVVVIFFVLPSVAIASVPGVLAGLMMAAPLVARRHFPEVTLAASTFFAALHVVFVEYPTGAAVVAPIVIYTVARWSSPQLSRLALLSGIIGSVLGGLRWGLSMSGYGYQYGSYRLNETVLLIVLLAGICLTTVVASYLIGRRRQESVAARDERAVAARERARLLHNDADQRARMAAINERTRIARELHDIVAHSLSVIVVQAEGGKALAAKKPEKGPEVLGTIAETSREALEETRRIVGLLRGNETSGEYRPAPGLLDIPDLVAKTSDRTRLIVHGEPPAQVPQALGLTAYRVVQEALTNVLKHAGPDAESEVEITYGPREIWLQVTDDGRGDAVVSDGHGNGLRGMHERVTVIGGRLLAQPRIGGGFQVRAILPMPPHHPPPHHPPPHQPPPHQSPAQPPHPYHQQPNHQQPNQPPFARPQPPRSPNPLGPPRQPTIPPGASR